MFWYRFRSGARRRIGSRLTGRLKDKIVRYVVVELVTAYILLAQTKRAFMTLLVSAASRPANVRYVRYMCVLCCAA